MHAMRKTTKNKPEPLMGLEKMRREFAKLDAHIRDKVAEIERKAKEGGLAYEMAVRACNRAEREEKLKTNLNIP